MVPRERIELSASPLPRVRSTTELPRHNQGGAPITAKTRNVKPCLKPCAFNAKTFRMSEGKDKNMSREERLAAKLRENLRRRKSQTREMKSESRQEGVPNGDPES